MTVTLGNKTYALKDYVTIGMMFESSALSEKYGAAFSRYIARPNIVNKFIAIRSFRKFCNTIFVQKWYRFIGIKVYRDSVFNLPMKEVKSLQETFFAMLEDSKTEN